MRTLIIAWAVSGMVGVASAPRDNSQDASAPVVSEVLATQVLLDRVGFSPGEIDGQPGANLQRALDAFRRAQSLAPAEGLDPATWQRLSEAAGGQAPLVSYTITAEDVAGPFEPEIPADLVKQSKLSALSYRNALEALAEKFHASPRLLQSLNPGASFTRAGEHLNVPNIVLTAPPAPPRRGEPIPPVTIVVTKQTSALTVEGQDGRVLFHAPVTTGSEHDPLPIGQWKVTTVQSMPAFHYNPDLFWDANPSHSKARIAPGPNNPVGVAWIDITKEHYGIHGAPEPSRVGHTESHGCVRLTNWDVRRLMEWARPGTPVAFR